MKPSELRVFKSLPPYLIRAYRAHRPGETDWISYTLSPVRAAKFALRRGVREVTEYSLPKKDVMALFLRRDEQELIMLDPAKAKFIERVQVVTTKEALENGSQLLQLEGK